MRWREKAEGIKSIKKAKEKEFLCIYILAREIVMYRIAIKVDRIT